MPHCIKSAALPVTNGAAKEVPVTASYPPPAFAVMISTPGAARSGFTCLVCLVKPRPEKSAYARFESLYAPTEITPDAVEGIVSVVSGTGRRKRVEGFKIRPEGSQKS